MTPDCNLNRGISYIRTGAFSGSAISLRNSLSELVPLKDIDIYENARDVTLLASRVYAMREARRHGGVPWSKTAAWSRANQRLIERRLAPWSMPAVIVQTMSAMVPPRNVPYVVYTDRVAREPFSGDPSYRGGFTPDWAAREYALLTGAKHVFVMGPSTAAALTECYGVETSRSTVVGAAPNFALQPRRRLPSGHRLLFVGTQWNLKGGPELLGAFNALRSEYPDLTLIIVGCTPDIAVPEGVTVVGRVAPVAMDALYEDSDVLCLPTRSEAFGIAFVEALQKGMPCVGTDVGNLPWIIGEAGVCSRMGDVRALTQALRAVLDDYPRFAAKAATRGKKLGAEYSWAKIARRIYGALEHDGGL